MQKKDWLVVVLVDYHALKETIAVDKFPMPWVDDLLYELNRSHIFISLDLEVCVLSDKDEGIG